MGIKPQNYHTPNDSDNHHALSLLGAAPFLLRDNVDFIWQDASLCKDILRIRQGSAPVTTDMWLSRLSPAAQRLRADAMSNLTWDGAQYAVIYPIQMDDIRELYIEERGERLSGLGAVATEISGIILNVDNAQAEQRRAAYAANHDSLTGLWNRARFSEGLEHMIAFTRRYRAKAICLQLRVSNIADINTTYGYETGDRLLKSIAKRLEEVTSAPDILARISGVNFGLGFYNTHQKEAEPAAMRVYQSLTDTPYISPHGPLFAEIDMGFTMLGDVAQTAASALTQTHIAIMSAQGRTGSLTAYTPDMSVTDTPRPKHETSADDILAALNDRRISLAFQPIVDAQTRDLHHYECLLRLRTDDGEVVSAGAFIMAAERLGLVHMLDRRALELAGEALRQYPDIHIALNISAATVKDIATAEAYITALKALGPDVKRVTLELTETVTLEDPAMASRFSVQARALGCEFAIDDFGSGYTTFRNLMAIEADTIKIDGTFIEGIAKIAHKETFVRMMVDLAQTFGVKTVAEMVDSRADADLLKRLGVDYLQGYMFGIPSAAPAWRRTS